MNNIPRSVLLRATARALRPHPHHRSSLKLHTATLQAVNNISSPLPHSNFNSNPCRYEKLSVTSTLLRQLRLHSAVPIKETEEKEKYEPLPFSEIDNLHPNSLLAVNKMLGQNATASESCTSDHGVAAFHLYTGFMPRKLAMACTSTAPRIILQVATCTPRMSRRASCSAVMQPQSSWMGNAPRQMA